MEIQSPPTRPLRSLASRLIPLTLATAALVLGGCYTQLYTQSYYQRSLEYAGGRPGPGDKYGASDKYGTGAGYPLAGESGEAFDRVPCPDSVLEARKSQGLGADTLCPADSLLRTSPAIVNNYYDNRIYRGYGYEDWEFPYLSFGFYSGRYRHYHDPFWWDHSRHGQGHWRHHRHGRGSGGGGSGGGGSGAYKSDKRLFGSSSDLTGPDKGQRRNPPEEKGRRETPEAVKSTDPEPSTSSGGGEEKAADKQTEKQQESKREDHPRLEKGRRR